MTGRPLWASPDRPGYVDPVDGKSDAQRWRERADHVRAEEAAGRRAYAYPFPPKRRGK